MAPLNKQPSVKEEYENLDDETKRRVQQHGTEHGHRVTKIKGSGPENPLKILRRVLAYTFRNKLAAVLLVVLIVLSSAAGAVGSFLLTFVINAIESVARGEAEYMLLVTWIIAVAAVYVVGVACTFAYNRLMMYIAQGTLKRMRDEMFVNMQYLPLRYFDTHTHGELMSRYTNDVDTLRQMLSQSVPQMISAVVTIVVVLLCMIFMSFTLTLVMLVILSVNIVCIRFIGAESSRQFLKQQVSIGKVNGYVEEMMEGQKVIKVFCHEDKARENFKAINEELRLSGTRANQLTNMLGPMSNILSYFQYVVVAIVGAAFFATHSAGALSLYSVVFGDGTGAFSAGDVGVLVSFLTLIRSFNQPVQQVTQQFNAIVMGLAGAERIFDIFDTPHEDKGGDTTLVYGEGGVEKWSWKRPEQDGTYSYIPLRGDIRFKDVIFGYTPDKIILKDISLYAKPGQKIAFVGATGAGKTTITNLINRFYDIQSGTITYDGLDIKSINKDDLRRSLGIVLQDTHLFTGTVMNNIRYGRLNATDEECVAAAKLANADYFISHLPDGYNTMIKGDGANLSQGQRQLLAIARAMVSECPVLILDEATSSIDTRTEKLIEEGMDKLMEGRTVFVIAHRLSTVRNSQAIMVLDHGRIIERGTHDQLISQRGVYYQLYTGAFELE
ncbi:MAG TPA: ABC transporter ATP-binding protein [Candidatus Coproplasma avistercoris]|nr:ABC transporter ATP-binding protein [Candidatus Coproplasma avistercoris]